MHLLLAESGFNISTSEGRDNYIQDRKVAENEAGGRGEDRKQEPFQFHRKGFEGRNQ
jgi:hypothetical protein